MGFAYDRLAVPPTTSRLAAPDADPILQAQQSLKSLLHHWSQATTAAHPPIEARLRKLKHLHSKLEQQRLTIAIFGMVNRGKSAVLNALMGKSLLETGPLNGVTRKPCTLAWQPKKAHGSPIPAHYRVDLVDTPGLNEVEGEVREQLAWSVAERADLILFVIAGDLTQIEYQALLELRALHKPILLVFNKIDLYPEQDRQSIYAQITSAELRQLMSPAEIVLVAAAPKPVRVRIHWPDGQISYEWERPEPQIDQLREKIEMILRQEGAALLGLNVLLQADQHLKQIMAVHDSQQRESMRRLNWQVIGGKTLLITLNPLGVLDLLISGVADLSLITLLSRLLHTPISPVVWGKMFGPLALTLGSLALLEVGTGGLLGNALLSPESWPGLAPPGSSFAWGNALLQGVLAWGGGQWLQKRSADLLPTALLNHPTSPHTRLVQILEQLPSQSILYRLKSEFLQLSEDSLQAPRQA
ncbi:MAG: DUF697 domain-containing protein [Synechococcaceae cyanobacterium SM2_3_1]|nr:DUF697 domain-containing protein [Synechococcaceae cyanobacterium SM2_3_1]